MGGAVIRLRSGTAPSSGDRVGPAVPGVRRSHVGGVVAGSLAAGLAAAVILPFLPLGTVDEDFSTAMVLLGFALGWALLAVLSTRFTDQPQGWAVAPAVFMVLSGALVLLAPDAVVDALAWVWPPALVVLVVWVWARAKRDLHSRTRVWLLNPVLVVLVLVALGGAYETISGSTGPAVAMRGRLVDVGPYRLHLECTGSRGPTVILEPGAGGSAASMGLIAPAVARDTRVCVYDRAGRGWSDPRRESARWRADRDRPPHPAASRHVPGPYVLAGHSFGGLYVRTFAALLPRGGRRHWSSSTPPPRPPPTDKPAPPEAGFLQLPEAPVLVGRDELPPGWGLVGSSADTSFSVPPAPGTATTRAHDCRHRERRWAGVPRRVRRR